MPSTLRSSFLLLRFCGSAVPLKCLARAGPWLSGLQSGALVGLLSDALHPFSGWCHQRKGSMLKIKNALSHGWTDKGLGHGPAPHPAWS